MPWRMHFRGSWIEPTKKISNRFSWATANGPGFRFNSPILNFQYDKEAAALTKSAPDPISAS